MKFIGNAGIKDGMSWEIGALVTVTYAQPIRIIDMPSHRENQ